MTRPVLFALILGLGGAAILLSLGVWQMSRLAEKEAYLARIERMIGAPPAPLPAAPDPEGDRFLPVALQGELLAEGLRVLASRKQIGPGHRLIQVLRTDDGRRILIDLGFAPQGAPTDPVALTGAVVTGNLHWPEEADRFTPPPDAATGQWFARDVPAMAAALGTEPVLVVARGALAPGVEPMPVDTSGIPNDHLEYAITWFSLAAVWLGMTGYLLWRIRRRTA
jgi:surfeit locus 1 family protein